MPAKQDVTRRNAAGFKRCHCITHRGPLWLPVSEFGRSRNEDDGLSRKCRECTNKSNKKYADKSKAARLAAQVEEGWTEAEGPERIPICRNCSATVEILEGIKSSIYWCPGCRMEVDPEYKLIPQEQETSPV